MNLIHKLTFFIRQAVRIGGIYRWKVRVTKGILLTFVDKDTTLKIYLLQQFTICHSKLRTAVDDLGFQLKLDNSDRLVHLSNQAQRFLIIMSIGKIHFRHENGARIISVSIHSKGSKRQQIDSVTVFKCSQITISHRHTYHIGYATVIAGSGAHPQNIVIAPLNIEIMIIAQGIHNDMRSRSAIIDVAYDMK